MQGVQFINKLIIRACFSFLVAKEAKPPVFWWSVLTFAFIILDTHFFCGSLFSWNTVKDQMFCISWSAYIKELTPSLTTFGDGVSKEIVKVKWDSRIHVLIRSSSFSLSLSLCSQRKYHMIEKWQLLKHKEK